MFGTIHRKSAVELLQESKASYVKSEMVLDRKQELRHSKHLQVSSPIILHSPTFVLKKSPSSELWRRDTPENESTAQFLDFLPAPSIYATAARRRRSPPPPPPPPDEDQVLVEQLQQALSRGPPEHTCTCHVVFKKVVTPQTTPRVSHKSPRRESRASRHRADSASRDQLQIKLRRLLGDEENEEPIGFGVNQSQQHKSMPDLRGSMHGSDSRKHLNSPGLSLRSGEGVDNHSVSPAFTVPEISWRFFDDEPITLRAPEGFRDKDTDDAFDSEPEQVPLDSQTVAKLDKFFGQFGQNDDALRKHWIEEGENEPWHEQTFIKMENQRPSKRRESSSQFKYYRLDKTILSSEGSSPIFFESIGSAETPHSSDGTDPPRFAGLTSVVERNARIIKWLCNCRKAGLPAACMPS